MPRRNDAPSNHKLLVYLCYGEDDSYWLELRLSLLSALRFLRPDDGISILIATDHPERVATLGVDVTLEHLTPAMLKEWRGPHDYGHRIKNSVVPWLIDRHNAPVCLVDTDTYFYKSPRVLFDRVGPRRTVMHKHEDLASTRRIQRALDCEILTGPDKTTWTISSAAMRVWNSGVIGVDPADRPALDAVLWMSDEVYERTQIFNVEQFAFGRVFESTTQLSRADDVCAHYWGMARPFVHERMRRFLATFGDRTVDEQAAATASFSIKPPRHPLPRRILVASWRRWLKLDAPMAAAALAAAAGDPRRPRDPEFQRIWRDLSLRWIQESSAADIARCSSHFTAVRDDEALALMDAPEREQWRAFWHNADA